MSVPGSMLPFWFRAFAGKPAASQPPQEETPADNDPYYSLMAHKAYKKPAESNYQMVGGHAVEKGQQAPRSQPNLAPLGPAVDSAMDAVGSGWNSMAAAGDEALSGARIRAAQLARAGERHVPSPPTRPTATQEQPEAAAPQMSDRRAQWLRNDFLRRMASRHEEQLGKAGMGYGHLEQEYDNAPGSHQDKQAAMAHGLLSRLRAAREMDISKRVRERSQQDAMARRLGVPVAGVVFSQDLQNAQTPEDRIRTALSYHGMFPNLGLGNFASQEAQNLAEGRGMEAMERIRHGDAQANREFAGAEADANRQQQLAMQLNGLKGDALRMQGQADIQGQALAAQGQQQVNAIEAQNRVRHGPAQAPVTARVPESPWRHDCRDPAADAQRPDRDGHADDGVGVRHPEPRCPQP